MNAEPAWEDMGEGALPPSPEDARHARQREPRHATPSAYARPAIVTQARCQAHVAGCRNLVGVTAEAIGMVATFDRILAARGETPLDLNGCFPCAEHETARAEAMAARTVIRDGKITEAIRYLHNIPLDDVNRGYEQVMRGPTADRLSNAAVCAVERLGWLVKVQGGGYVSDLVNALRERSRSGGRGKPRSGDL